MMELRVPQQVTAEDLQAMFRRYSTGIEQALREAVPVTAGESDTLAPHNQPFAPAAGTYTDDPGLAALSEFYGMLRYHMGWLDAQLQPASADSGKKLRPVICLLATEAAGGDYTIALPATAAIELVHNFSLIHDDIEDKSDQRRHRDTVWKLWGEPLAINAGDAMYTLARMALYRLRIPAERLLEAAQILDATCLRLTEGQYLDMAAENRLDIGEARYLTMIGRKTAALVACACQLGSLLAGGDRALVEAYRRFGQQLGMAFQIRDDVLGIWGAAEDTGKPAADDLWKRKKTIPIIYMLAHTEPAERLMLERIYARTTFDTEDIQTIMAILDRTGAHAYTQQLAEQFARQALNELAVATALHPAETDSQQTAQQDLAGLTIFSYTRDK